jgi:alanyl-tRNA synthetase
VTERLYYHDSLLNSFDATVIGCEPAGDRFAVVLDRTAFYPTSGGQPFDTGTLGSARVVDVMEDDDGTVRHLVDAPVSVGGVVHGAIDWDRRVDHMQQHTGQHMISAAFDRLHGARTLSFHLSADVSTIDLSREVTPAEIASTERDVNRVVWEDRPVDVRFVTSEEASRLPLRKEPARAGRLRLIDIADYDLSACGGTHVPRTAMVGVIAVSAWERFKGGSRVTFVCGGRALDAFDRFRDIAAGASRALSVSTGEIGATIERLKTEARDQARVVRQLQEETAGHRAVTLRQIAETIGGYRVVLTEQPDWDAAALKTLAQAIVAEPGMVAILVGGGRPVPVVIARSTDVPVDAGAFISRATKELGGRGGGRPEFAQGGLAVDASHVLMFARQALGVALSPR